MKRRETNRSDSRLHRSEYKFWENTTWYCMETAYTKGRKQEKKENERKGTTAYHKPGQDFHMYEKKIEDCGFIMYRSKQGLIDKEIFDIIYGYGDYEDFRAYERFMSDKEKVKCLEGLDEEDKEKILQEEIKNILNGCGDYRDFHIYKEYISEEDKEKCLEAFEKYY